MAVVVDVTLLSGQRVSLQADLTAWVESLADPWELAEGDSSVRLAAFSMEMRSWEQPKCKQEAV